MELQAKQLQFMFPLNNNAHYLVSKDFNIQNTFHVRHIIFFMLETSYEFNVLF